jgi:Tfp pilus assembly protein PilF
VLLLGFLVVPKHRPAIGSGSTLAEATNKTEEQGLLPGPLLTSGGSTPKNEADNRSSPSAPAFAAGGSDSDHSGTTNGPDAAQNREASGGAADLNNQGMHLLEAGDPKGAIPLFEQGLALNPDDETIHFNLGCAYLRIANLTNAEHEYKEALRLLPDYADAHNNYGVLLIRLGHLAEAEMHLNEAVKQMPESAEYHNNLGLLRERLRQTNEAVRCFQDAVKCNSNYLEAHFNLGRAYLLQRNREKGVGELREVLRIKPGFEPAQRALALAMGQQTSNAPPGAADRK